jgi:hypothetical protein
MSKAGRLLPASDQRQVNNIFGFAAKALWDDLGIGDTVGQAVGLK